MRVPKQTSPVIRFASAATFGPKVAIASDCPWYKKVACGAAVSACAASCLAGPEACMPCFASSRLIELHRLPLACFGLAGGAPVRAAGQPTVGSAATSPLRR